jgi:UDP-2,3-diacylglucosamine pyrophosphatase LpxH
VGGQVDFTFEMKLSGVHIEHGHRFEEMNVTDYSSIYRQGPNDRKILNLPWGSLFCILILPALKKERPYIDRVRPFGAYLWWAFLHDFRYFLQMVFIILKYFFEGNANPYLKQKADFRSTFRVLKKFTLYPNYEKKAHSILRTHPECKVVVMGHTHLQQWRRFPNERYYFNTGTWNSIPSMDPARYQNITQLTYVSIDMGPRAASVGHACLNIWQGKWRPYREEVKVGPA